MRCSFDFYHSIVLTDLQSGTTSGGETLQSGIISLEEFCWLHVSHQIVYLGIKFLFFTVPSDCFMFITHPKSKPGWAMELLSRLLQRQAPTQYFQEKQIDYEGSTTSWLIIRKYLPKQLTSLVNLSLHVESAILKMGKLQQYCYFKVDPYLVCKLNLDQMMLSIYLAVQSYVHGYYNCYRYCIICYIV